MDPTTPDAASLTSDRDAPASPLEELEHLSADERLEQLSRRATAILERWTIAGERHERAVNQLETQLSEFEVASARLQHDAAVRLQELERTVQHEWSALRDVHEEPIKQLREQANSLTEVAIATAHSAQRGFDQAEARLAAIELELQQRILDLRREVQTVLQELRGQPGLSRLAANPPAWPLEGVTRLHQQLRRNAETASEAAPVEPPALLPAGSSTGAPPMVDASSPARPAAASSTESELADRVRVLERALNERRDEERVAPEPIPPTPSLPRAAIAAIVAFLLIGGGFAWWLQVQVRQRVDAAERRSQEVSDAASRQMAQTQEQASREIAAARDVAAQAQIVSAALAAPDLIRFVLVATGENVTGSAQALWSRTRGFVLSGSRLAPLPSGNVYQVWLVTRTQPISAGTVTPDASGSATLAVAPPTTLRVIGVVVTQEPEGGSASPLGRPLLVRVSAANQ